MYVGVIYLRPDLIGKGGLQFVDQPNAKRGVPGSGNHSGHLRQTTAIWTGDAFAKIKPEQVVSWAGILCVWSIIHNQPHMTFGVPIFITDFVILPSQGPGQCLAMGWWLASRRGSLQCTNSCRSSFLRHMKLQFIRRWSSLGRAGMHSLAGDVWTYRIISICFTGDINANGRKARVRTYSIKDDHESRDLGLRTFPPISSKNP
jgi:hypothetical protein